MSPRVAAVVLAGGTGQRFGGVRNKVYLEVAGHPMLAYSLAAMERCEAVTRIVLVIREADRSQAAQALRDVVPTTPRTMVLGGRDRQASETAALVSLAEPILRGELDLVAIHDGARPFLSSSLLDRLIEVASETGAAIPGIEPTDALWDVSNPASPAPLTRRLVRAAQTPQVFDARTLLDAYRRAVKEGFVGADTATSIARFTNLAVALVPGDADNIKVTFEDDLLAAERIAARWPSPLPSD